MAQVKFNPLLTALLGHVGGLVFRTRRGRMYVSRKPDVRLLKFNDAQRGAQQRFRQAARYAKEVMADPVARAAYDMAGKEEDRSVQNLIMADFLRAPSVDEIDLGEYDGQAGSRILIRASDDFDVTGVEVVISAVTGGEIERGAAIPSSTDLDSWVYTATASVPDTHVRVEVTAIDRPGHKTTKVENV